MKSIAYPPDCAHMRREQSDEPDHVSDLSEHEGSTAHQTVSRNEAVHIRSYDHQEAYDLDIEFVKRDGETAFEKHYYLLPGHIESESSIVPSGNYEIRVSLDNSHGETLECRIDSSLDHTAVMDRNGLAQTPHALVRGFDVHSDSFRNR